MGLHGSLIEAFTVNEIYIYRKYSNKPPGANSLFAPLGRLFEGKLIRGGQLISRFLSRGRSFKWVLI